MAVAKRRLSVDDCRLRSLANRLPPLHVNYREGTDPDRRGEAAAPAIGSWIRAFSKMVPRSRGVLAEDTGGGRDRKIAPAGPRADEFGGGTF